jgi:hypothetical protein
MSGTQLVHGLVQFAMFGSIRINHLGKKTDLLGGLYEVLKTDGEIANPSTSLKELLKDFLGMIEHEIFFMRCFR